MAGRVPTPGSAGSDDVIACETCGYTTERFDGWAFCGPCRTPGEPSHLHDFRLVPSHTEAFAEFVAAKREAEAGVVTVSWRKVDAQTGGGYSGLASTGERVYVVRVYVVRVERTRVEGDTTLWRGTWEYGRMNGPKREFAGNAGTLSHAKLVAGQLCGKTPPNPQAAPAAADPEEADMARNTRTGKPNALAAIVKALTAKDPEPMTVPDIIAAVHADTGLHEKTIYGALYADSKKDDALVQLVAKRTFKLAQAPGEVPPVTEVKPPAAAAPAVAPEPPAALEQLEPGTRVTVGDSAVRALATIVGLDAAHTDEPHVIVKWDGGAEQPVPASLCRVTELPPASKAEVASRAILAGLQLAHPTPLSQKEILAAAAAAGVEVSKSTVSRQVAAMLEAGTVLRTDDGKFSLASTSRAATLVETLHEVASGAGTQVEPDPKVKA